MNRITDVIEYAQQYLFDSQPVEYKNDHTWQDLKLHKQLQYLLCNAADKLIDTFGEVARKDIAILIEAWIISKGTLQPDRPVEMERDR